MIVRFSNKGGQIAGVTLKSFPNSTKTKVVLGDSTNLNYPVNIGNNQTLQINQVVFSAAKVTEENGVKKLEYVWTSPNGKTIKHVFSIAPKKYNIEWFLHLKSQSHI